MLILLPNTLGGTFDERYFAQGLAEAVANLDGLIAENVPAGRAFMKKFNTKKPAHLMPIAHLKKESTLEEIDFYLAPAKTKVWGLISDAGLPCLADPGARVVDRANQKKIPVELIMGPSSLIMGLLLSGFSAQNFTFHGYMPKQDTDKALKVMLKSSMTHLFIEAPFRNDRLFKSLMRVLPDEIRLCLAIDLTMPTQKVITEKVSWWKRQSLKLDGHNILFLVEATK